MATNIIKWSVAALLLSVIFGLFKWPFQPVIFFCAFCCVVETAYGWWMAAKAMDRYNKAMAEHDEMSKRIASRMGR